MLSGKRIILGVTGGIAAYKAVELLRELVNRGAEVYVTMTENATRFVGPITFQTLSQHPVLTDIFQSDDDWRIGHISITERADVFVIAPATANIIGKIASGIADDMLSTMIMACKAPKVIAPAMNENMWESSFVKKNIRALKDAGYRILEPEMGELACGIYGKGRLAATDDIIEEIISVLTKKDLLGEKILVTAGPTREAIDPVRFISNPSTGKMGFALARVAKRRGADVILISGPVTLKPPRGVETHFVTSAIEMRDIVLKHYYTCSVVIKAAAVSDFRPDEVSREKIKKDKDGIRIRLRLNPDILEELGSIKEGRILVGFAAETENLLENAMEKIRKKNLDFIVVNDVSSPTAGFGADTNKVYIIDSSGKIDDLPLMSKEEVASKILDKIIELKKHGK